MENEIVETKTTGAKFMSRLSMVFATIWVAVGTILKALHILDIEETDIIYSGIAIVGLWSPTYMSIWLDKIKEIRFGSGQ